MLAYLNGQFMPLESATIPVWDYGFTMGVAISEQLRTFGGRLHLLGFHLDRLANGLAISGIEPGLSTDQISAIATEVVSRNLGALPDGQDLGIGIVITAGGHAVRAPAEILDLAAATVLIYALPLDFSSWSADYENGIRLSTVNTREIPSECVPRELKCRSRMHYFLAEREANKKSPGSRALLLDTRGFVAEGTTASLLAVKDRTLIAPHAEYVLPGVSVRFVEQVICRRLAIPFQRTDLTIADLHDADELLWLGTSAGILPVAELDGVAIPQSKTKPMFRRLITEWSAQVGMDLVSQAQSV